MTAPDSSQSVKRWRPRFQFSLRGVMVFTVGVALGLSWGRIHGWGWHDGEPIIAAAVFWIVLGLANQVRDLWAAFHRRADLTGEERWGWRFALFWRVGVAFLFLAYYLVDALKAKGLIYLPRYPGIEGAMVGSNLLRALFQLSLLIALWSGIARKLQKRQRAWPHVAEVLGIFAGAVMCLVLCFDQTRLPFLVATSVHAIERAYPAGFHGAGIDPDIAARTGRFLWQSAFGASLVLVNLGLMRQLACQWTFGGRRRWLWAVLLFAGLAFSAGYFLWVSMSAFPAAFPSMIDAQVVGPLNVWVLVVVVVTILVTTGAYRMTSATLDREPCRAIKWRRHERAYYHERRAVMLLVAATISYAWGRVLALLYADGYLWGILIFEPFYLVAPILIVAWYGGLAPRPIVRAPRADTPRLPIGRFCVFWVALCVTTVTGIPMIGLFSFAIWFSPWYAAGWP